MTLAERLKAMRKAEGITQAEFCELLGFSISTYKKYEAAMFEMGYGALIKVLQHPRFKKYTLWLMTGDTAPTAGQIGALHPTTRPRPHHPGHDPEIRPLQPRAFG